MHVLKYSEGGDVKNVPFVEKFHIMKVDGFVKSRKTPSPPMGEGMRRAQPCGWGEGE